MELGITIGMFAWMAFAGVFYLVLNKKGDK